jgi:hypothetical protein
MREGIFEAACYDSKTNKRFPEAEIDGMSYVISEPGLEYYVQLSVYRNSDQNWEYDYLRVGLFVDGFDVQYWKRLDFTDSTVNNADVLHGRNFDLFKYGNYIHIFDL